MNHASVCANRGRAVVAIVLLNALGLMSGCATGSKHTASDAAMLSYFPRRSAVEPSVPTSYQAEPCFYGYHGTCWRAWPEEWRNCPAQDSGVEVLSLPQGTVRMSDAVPPLPADPGGQPLPAPKP